MNIYTLQQVLSVAKCSSAIYRDLYKDLQISSHTKLEDVPLLTNETLMKIVHAEQPDFVFGAESSDGIIFESSASTGKAKVTLFGRGEWETSTRLIAAAHARNGVLKAGDRVANLCATPYISFRLVHSVVERFPGRCAEIPLGCEAPFDELNDSIEKYKANVLTGINSTCLGLAADLIAREKINPHIERILAGGELPYGRQSEMIKMAFPNAEMISFVFGTTESGPVAISQLGDQLDEFRPLSGAAIVEIVNEESGRSVTECGVIGKCVVTSLVRCAVPAIRIDTGDYGMWVAPPTSDSPKFRLLGRKFPFSHVVGDMAIDETEVWNLIQKMDRSCLTKFQLELHRDKICIVYSFFEASADSSVDLDDCLRSAVLTYLPNLEKMNLPILFRKVDFMHFLESTRRKGRLVIDYR